jgi:hypothetical protein
MNQVRAREQMARQYSADFLRLFQIVGGSLVTNDRNLQDIENWFNNSYLLITLITGIPLQPVRMSASDHATTLHVFSVCYTMFLSMCVFLNQEVPIELSAVVDVQHVFHTA